MIAGLKPYPSYHEIDPSAFGSVPAHWSVMPMARVAALKSVVNQPERQLLSVYLQRGVVRFTDIEEKRTNVTSQDLSRYQVVDPGDFVLNNQQAWRGSVGVSQFAGIVSPAYLVLSLSQSYLTGYANFLFRDQSMVSQYLICSKGVGTIQRNLYWPHLKRVEVVMPPLTEQAAIVKFLNWADGRLERAIRSKRKIIALLNEQKQAIIHRAITHGLDSSVSRKDSGIPWIGEIPAHWQLARLKNVLSRNDGGVWGTDFADDGTIVLRSTEQAVDGEWRILNPARIRLPDSAVATTRLKEGDLLITKSSGSADHIGKTSLVTEEIAAMGCCYSNFMQRLRLKGTDNPKFIATLLNSRTGRQHYRVSSTSTTGLGNLTATVIGNLPFGLPPPEEQSEIIDYLADALSGPERSISALASEIALLHEYRMRLVADVVTGKLDVRDAANRLPEDAPADESAHDSNLFPVDEQDAQEAAQ